jgi:hypothetical protein
MEEVGLLILEGKNTFLKEALMGVMVDAVVI